MCRNKKFDRETKYRWSEREKTTLKITRRRTNLGEGICDDERYWTRNKGKRIVATRGCLYRLTRLLQSLDECIDGVMCGQLMIYPMWWSQVRQRFSRYKWVPSMAPSCLKAKAWSCADMEAIEDNLLAPLVLFRAIDAIRLDVINAIIRAEENQHLFAKVLRGLQASYLWSGIGETLASRSSCSFERKGSKPLRKNEYIASTYATLEDVVYSRPLSFMVNQVCCIILMMIDRRTIA